MANAVTGYKLFSIETSKAVSPRFIQFIELDITGDAADVAWDLNDSGGTFWTAAKATSTGAAALAALLNIAAGAVDVMEPVASFKRSRVRLAAATGAGDYAEGMTSGIPTFTFNAGNGPTAEKLVLGFLMPQGYVPVSKD